MPPGPSAESVRRREIDVTGADPYGLSEAVDRGDWHDVAGILSRRGAELVALSDQMSEIAGALASMPADVIAAHPLLHPILEFLGLVEITDDLPAVDSERIRAHGQAGELEIRSIIASISARRVRGRVDLACELSDAAEPHVVAAASQLGSAAETVASSFFINAGKAHLLAGHNERATSLLLLAWRWRHADSLGFVAKEAAGLIAVIAASTGGLRFAEEWIPRSQAWPGAIVPRLRVIVEFGAPLAEFIVATERLDLRRAGALLSRLAPVTQGFEFPHLVTAARTPWLQLAGPPRAALR